MTCDKIVEGMERFDISLTLTSSNPQMRIGRDRSQVRIIDSTGKWYNSSEYRRWCDRINYTVVVNFKQSSYEVMEDRGEVTVMIDMNQPSSKSFEVVISSMDVTANGKRLTIIYHYWTLLQMERIIE